jgi:glycosyltransferase involved in cell wall biosynthesis
MRESLCMKRPVVCTDIGGNGELVRDGETGRLVPPDDEGAFVEAVIDLLTHREDAHRMAQAGYELVLHDFTEEVRINKLERLYYQLVDAQRGVATPD